MLFIVAIAVMVVALDIVAWLAWKGSNGGPVPVGLYFLVSIGTLAVVLGGTVYQSIRLGSGGAEVARMMGGELITPESAGSRERRLLNIVEEISIASGVACPRVYVMREELSINAFAAGTTPNEAVIAVSAGAMNRLERDELQGVVAHEFSHILNGDMKLNMRLIGVVFGLMLLSIIGRQLLWGQSRGSLRSSDSRRSNGVMLGVGLALVVLGLLGNWFGRMICAAISREREYLADASAVQFTRNPDGIGGALRKIAGLGARDGIGSKIANPNAEAAAHLFLGATRAGLASGLLATHPPLDERIRRIYGHPMAPIVPSVSADAADTIEGLTSLPQEARSAPPPPQLTAHAAPDFSPAAAVALVSSSMATPQGFAQRLVAEDASRPLLAAVQTPLGAQAAIIALALDALPEIRERQLAGLDTELRPLVQRLAPSALQVHRTFRLPLVDLAVPALKRLDADQRRRLLAQLEQCAMADGRVALQEWVLMTLVAQRMRTDATRVSAVRYKEVSELRGDVALVVSLIAGAAAAEFPEFDTANRVDAASAQLGLTLPVLTREQIGMHGVQQSLERLTGLAPLRKPMLIKAFVAAALDSQGAMTLTGADLVRTVCATLDAPLPPVVEAFYLGSTA
ncbi:M48 family metallopeptidase [soil metagenome]